ncbi:MAG: alpha/beta hydrolase [Burkholderiaceae bacterium]|nr:alpha/beta hydrolase [Burkholderiaceae bacterium]
MNAGTQLLLIDGPVGSIDVAIDRPAGTARGIGVVAHPHPLYGGTRDNKVAQTLARALLALGHVVWRPNFRGVGATAGTHDEGRGETEDLLEVVRHARAQAAAEAPAAADPLPLVLAGFSFGTDVQIRVAARLREAKAPAQRLVLVGTAATDRYTLGDVPADTLVVHGEHDEVVPLQGVLDWARPQSLPVVVVPGAEHFFHRRLTLLKRIVVDALAPRAEIEAG